MNIKPVVLPIFHHTDESYDQMKLLNIDTPLEEVEVRKVKFFSIVAISPYTDEHGKQYTSIHANGSEYICALTPEEVDKKIVSLSHG